MKRYAQLLTVFALGCGGSSKQVDSPPPPPPPPPPAPALTCAAVVDKIFETPGEVPEAQLPGVKATVTTRCNEDKWSPESMKCFMDVKVPEDGKACQAMLSEAQVQSLAKALVELAKTWPQPPAAP